MKKFLLITAALFLASFAFSQSNKDEIALMQAAFGMDKKSVVAEFVKPSAAQKDAFWKIYDEYEAKRKELGIATNCIVRGICRSIPHNDWCRGRCMDKKGYCPPEKNR